MTTFDAAVPAAQPSLAARFRLPTGPIQFLGFDKDYSHELGHVAHRDGTRTVLQQGAMSLLFGLLLGDFVGGGAVIIAAKTILQTSYSRDVESSADAYAVDLMKALDADPRALGTGSSHSPLKLLLDHPETKERVDAINARAGAGSTKAILTPSEWADARRICSESKG